MTSNGNEATRRESLIARLRAHVHSVVLAAETEQLLRDAAAALLRSTPPGLAEARTDFVDTSWTPDEVSQADLVAAALDHAAVAGHAAAFVVQVPQTHPTLYVVFGEAEQIVHLLASTSAISDGH